MTEPAPSHEGTASREPAGPRLASVDVLRGAVIALMVLVNYVDDLPGAPAWTQHLSGKVDGYSLTDLVFPWFLFLAGVSIPLSLKKFLAPGRVVAALRRILPRALGLVLLGLVLESAERTDPAATGIGRHLWLILALAAAMLIWKVPTRIQRWRRRETIARVVAGAALALLIVLWRGTTDDGESRYFVFGWWGILGLIGWSYLVGASGFLLVRGSDRGLLGLAALMICVSIGTRLGRLDALVSPDALFRVPELFGTLSAIMVLGALAGTWLSSPEPGRVGRLVLLGLGLCAAGWLLRPLHGYHKNSATEGWALLAAGYGLLLLAGAHLALDGRRLVAPARWLALVGSNALLAYVLPDLFDAVAGLFSVRLMAPGFARGGWFGMANAAALTLLVMVVAGVASKRGFAMKL